MYEDEEEETATVLDVKHSERFQFAKVSRGEIKVSGTITEISLERFSLQTDGTYRADHTPMLVGMIGRRNQDGSSRRRKRCQEPF